MQLSVHFDATPNHVLCGSAQISTGLAAVALALDVICAQAHERLCAHRRRSTGESVINGE
ncbi:hypothetical protein AB0271_12830 [Kocuria palustris]|uniref:hypothetical protein n=1 Tax=Kocuria palustris TaxID=71999 RepID=UPI00344BE840